MTSRRRRALLRRRPVPLRDGVYRLLALRALAIPPAGCGRPYCHGPSA